MKTALKSFLFSLAMTSTTISAIDYQTYIQNLPKSELHVHLGGAYPIEYLETIATPEQIQLLKSQAKNIDDGINYTDAFKIFGTISQIINTDEKVKNGTQALCKAMKKDGVVYAEIRTGLKDLGSGLEGYLNSVLEGIKNENSENFQGRLLLSLQRNSKLSHAIQTVDLAIAYRTQGIVGIDLSGISNVGNAQDILPEILRAKKAGLLVAVHVGEAIGETDQLILLQTLNPDRVGHGVILGNEAFNWIKEHNVPVEVCLTSSLKVGMTQNYKDHPWLYQDGHPISLCTDDPLIFSTSLTKEMAKLYESGAKDLDFIEGVARKTIDQAFSKDLQNLKDRLHINITYVRAKPEMAEELTQFAIDSNGYYQYRNAPMDVVYDVFRTSEEDISNGLAKVMMENGEMIGFYTLRDIKGESGEIIHELKDLFIKPSYIGKGYGKILFMKAALDAKYELGWDYFQLESDPFAAGFYEKLGAEKLGTNPCLLNNAYETTLFRYAL